MMIISTKDTFAYVLREMVRSGKTPNVSMKNPTVSFIKGKGINIIGNEDIQSIFVFNEDVDFSANVVGNIFISVLCSELEEGDVELYLDGDNLCFGEGYCFATNQYHIESELHSDEPHILFSKEQFNDFEKDFYFSIGNYFQNPKSTDTLLFGIKTGEIYQIAPGANIYKISNINGTIDTSLIQKDFGHVIGVCVFPHKLFDLMKNEEKIKMAFNFDREYSMLSVWSNNLEITYRSPAYRTKVFLERLYSKNVEDDFTLKDLEPLLTLKEKLAGVAKYLFEDNEDLNINIKNDGSFLQINIEELEMKFPSQIFKEFEMNVNLAALTYLLEILPSDTKVQLLDRIITFQNKEESYFMVNCKV